MKQIILFLMLCLLSSCVFAQRKTLDIVQMRQLISQSKAENKLQVKAKNQQAANTAQEQANLTLLVKLKNTYRTIQERYNTLGTAINIADIGIYASPMVAHIINYQSQIVSLAADNPAMIVLAYQTEIVFVKKAESLVRYIAGLTLSFGDVNQMRVADRKLLFDFVLSELSGIQELSANLLNTLQYASLSSLIRSINPFADFIDIDRSLVESVLRNAKYLKQ